MIMPPALTDRHYPYGSAPLRPQWTSRWAQALASLTAISAMVSLMVHYGDWPIERCALLIALPALLGITLAFAPDPPALISRLAKRMAVAGCAAGTFAGPWLGPMLVAVPGLLAAAVVIGSLWESHVDA